MNGKAESLIDERWEQFVEIANKYLSDLKIKKFKVSDEIETILEMNGEALRHLNTEDCLTYAFLLDKYALIIQTELNGHSAKHNWAKHNLDISIGHIMATSQWGTTYTKYEEKRSMIVAENSYCRTLSTMSLESSSIINYLEGIAYKINTIAKTLKDLAYSKRKVE